MTKKLEELFDMEENPALDSDEYQEASRELEAIESQLPDNPNSITDLSTSDQEMDDLASKAVKHYDDLMDLGMNVESRYSGRIFEVAGQMLKINLDSKVAKLDKKLKMVELQLKKEKLDKEANTETNIVQGEGYLVTDRNSLLEKLKNMDK